MERILERPAPGSTERAEGSPEVLTRFAAGIAHDFNNLLTVITGYGELGVCAERDAATLKLYMGEILRAGYRAAEIVDLVLAYSGRQMTRMEPVEVNGLIGSMADFLSLYLGEPITLVLRLCGEKCRVLCDKGQLQWVLVSLVMNAKEAMPAGGRVELSTRCVRSGMAEDEGPEPSGPRTEIEVADTGCGIPAENLARIFEPYFTTKHASNRNALGMGLASAQGIARRFGGCIRAASQPGNGSTFRLSLPLAEASGKEGF